MARKGSGHGLRGTARTKKGGGVDRQRDGDARKEGNALRHTRNCNSFARGVKGVRERPRENRKNPKIGGCLGPCHSRPRDTSAFVKICHSKFALYGDVNEPFRRGLKM